MVDGRSIESQNGECRTLDLDMHNSTRDHEEVDESHVRAGETENGMRHAGSHQNNEEKSQERPWDAPRVILHWIESVWKSPEETWQHWTVDNYDGEDTYNEWKLVIPKEMENDTELSGLQYGEMRSKLIQVELEIGEAMETRREALTTTKARALTMIEEMMLNYSCSSFAYRLTEMQWCFSVALGKKQKKRHCCITVCLRMI